MGQDIRYIFSSISHCIFIVRKRAYPTCFLFQTLTVDDIVCTRIYKAI